MKKLCILLALLLFLGGCGQEGSQPQPTDRGKLVSFDIFAVNDLHGKLADTDTQPGLDELSAYLKQAQKAGNTIVLSTGDMWQGASESNLTEGMRSPDRFPAVLHRTWRSFLQFRQALQ